MNLNKLKTNHDEKGFTLIELMIVIAIIGILAAIAIPNYISYRDKAFCSAVESDAQYIAAGLADYFAIPSNVTFNENGGNQIVFPGGQTIILSGNNTAAAIAPIGNQYPIAVTDVAGRCPATYQANQPRWNAGTYSITL